MSNRGVGHMFCRRCGKSRQSDSIAACAVLESDMAHIFGFERSQLLLLPGAVDDYVGADNPVRFIDAFVDQLDLAAWEVRGPRRHFTHSKVMACVAFDRGVKSIEQFGLNPRHSRGLG